MSKLMHIVYQNALRGVEEDYCQDLFLGRNDDFRMVDFESLHGHPYYWVAKMHEMSCIYRSFVAKEPC